MAFLISRKSRDKYRFDESLFDVSGNAAFPDFKSVRQFAAKMEDVTVRAGEINAVGLMHGIFHHIIQLYMEQKNPLLLENADTELQKKLGNTPTDTALRFFADEFPSLAIYRGECSPEDYLDGTTGNVPHRLLLLEEMIKLWVTNTNPATPYKKELFDDSGLTKRSAYEKIIEQLELFFDSQPAFGTGEENRNLLALLKAPAIAAPDSLSNQLLYIKENWAPYLGNYMSRLLAALDLMKEEEKFGGAGPGETTVYDFSGASLMDEYERFTSDHDWMPRLVLMAKSTYVWLDQLSRKYRVTITRLDQVPDEELDLLARRGFTGLWLIGLWERSRASQKIKQLCGNPEATASAYSIYDYRAAGELGGEEAFNNLKHRARQRGIRMAGDMVPNHMGIDSPWVVEHPDWFLSLDYCPYPAYSFNGPNLSPDDRVSIFLEDHYYDRTDAAVVFKWVNNRSGEVRYIYHGNDGTAMPWNDTAQLNYLNPEVREAVTAAIFSVAEKFPVIRFDAAMTLSKKHYQRLWFPEPGSGGDIPTRAEHGISREEFQHRMPEEFWRRVVDRFSESGSDTLLLAEAFWLMETYFVRTLGMHRVYNSAFMHFLKDEENAKFRTSIKNVLDFNPEILKRFVNFMNNPDEETAVVQFGKEDKYFGVCTLMATLPGLPMFGHGQIEGFSEKYGMEYRRAYWDETPDEHIIRRHEKEIFPLLQKRYLFAEVEHFLLFDFYNEDGWVNENVIAYSNRRGTERCLVIYHNTFDTAEGWIKTSVTQKSLAEGLDFDPGDNTFIIFRDQASGLEYIRDGKELRDTGLYVELEAYKRNVFLDFRMVEDDERGFYARLTAKLRGKGVEGIDKALRMHFLNPLSEPFQDLVNPDFFGRLESVVWTAKTSDPAIRESGTALMEDVEKRLVIFLEAVRRLTGGSGEPAKTARRICRELERFMNLPVWLKGWHKSGSEELRRAAEYARAGFDSYEFLKPVFIIRLFLHRLPDVLPGQISEKPETVRQLLQDWLPAEKMSHLFLSRGTPEAQTRKALRLIKVLTLYPDLTVPGPFDDLDVRDLMGVNRHGGTLWIHKESSKEVLYWFFLSSVLNITLEAGSGSPTPSFETGVIERFQTTMQLEAAIEQSGFQMEKFIEEISVRR